MSIKENLITIKKIAADNKLSEPYIVGGLPRDKILGNISDIQDIDLTSGDNSIHDLSKKCAVNFKVYPKVFEDGHSQLFIDGIKYDFSSNYNSPDVNYFLNKAGVKNPPKMILELLSRDFTCNTLILPLGFRKIMDPTGLAIDDIKKKIIRTPLPPRITLRDDPKRVVRAIYLSCKLDFKIEEDIFSWVNNNHKRIKETVSDGFSKKKISQAASFNLKKTIDILNEMNLWDVISIPNDLLAYQPYRRYK